MNHLKDPSCSGSNNGSIWNWVPPYGLVFSVWLLDIKTRWLHADLKSSHEGPESLQGLNCVTFPQINQRMMVCGVLENYLDILVVQIKA